MTFKNFLDLLLTGRGQFALIKTKSVMPYAIRHKTTLLCPIAYAYSENAGIKPDIMLNENYQHGGIALGLSKYLIEQIAAAADNKEGKYTRTSFRVKLLETLELEEGY